MSDKDKIKNASNNMIDLMSKFGKQFLVKQQIKVNR